MIDNLKTVLEPVQGNVVDLSVALTGILSTLACFVPKDSKLGKGLRYLIAKISSLKGKK